MKAKYLGCVRDGWQHTELHYEYKGYDYFITKHNNGYMDKSLKQQHEDAQAEIDERIKHKNDPIPMYKYEGSAQEGFDLFFSYVEGETYE